MSEEEKKRKSLDWQSNKAVVIAALIVLLLGLYLIAKQLTQRPPGKLHPFICIRPDGTLERYWINTNSKWFQKVWRHGIGPGPCPDGEGEAYISAVCPRCGHTYLDKQWLGELLPEELTHSSCPNCARIEAEMSEQAEELEMEEGMEPKEELEMEEEVVTPPQD
jgi:hypothetical protein